MALAGCILHLQSYPFFKVYEMERCTKTMYNCAPFEINSSYGRDTLDKALYMLYIFGCEYQMEKGVIKKNEKEIGTI